MKAALVLLVIMTTILCFQPALLLASPPRPSSSQQKVHSSPAGAVDSPSANHVVVVSRKGRGGKGGGRGSGRGRVIPIYGGAHGHGKGHRSGSERRLVGDIKLPAVLLAVVSIVILLPTWTSL